MDNSGFRFALTKWAKDTGAVIVFPEYGLAPEHHYPYGLDQHVDVYEVRRLGQSIASTRKKKSTVFHC